MHIVTLTSTVIPRVNSNYSRTNSIHCRMYRPPCKIGSPYEQRRYYSEISNDQGKKLHNSEAFKNYASGMVQLVAVATGLFALCTAVKKEERVDEKERKNAEEIKSKEQLIDAAKKLGLENVMTASHRTLEQQAKEYVQAGDELFIIGVSGTRIFDHTYKTDNPIPATIQKLLGNGVKIHLMIYNPDNAKLKSQLRPRDITKIKDNLSIAQQWQKTFPNHFECRYLKETPPFHGDLIDSTTAHVILIPRAGIHAANHANMETYGDGPKIKLIKADFETLWQNSDKIKCS